MKKGYLIVLVLLFAGILAFFIFSSDEASGITATYYKSVSCGCCEVHSRYLDSKGFDIKINNLQDVSSIKNNLGIPYELQSCHTTIIESYFVEGHVPIEAINKLLEERPNIKGISLPGMPSGSPGMTGTKNQDFVIYAVNYDGSYEEFMKI